MIFREHMQLVLGLSGFECPEGEKGIFLEEGVSEIQDEDVGLGIVLAQPVLCHRINNEIIVELKIEIEIQISMMTVVR
jgi:hypothetical protein